MRFLNILRQFNSYFHNTTPTRNSACLDNVFSNTLINNSSTVVFSCPYTDHDTVYFSTYY